MDSGNKLHDFWWDGQQNRFPPELETISTKLIFNVSFLQSGLMHAVLSAYNPALPYSLFCTKPREYRADSGIVPV
ncbi:MAG: hypothetical protein MPK62_15705 [Alphaproteobacteria bacterium]|nr:hypothetical protein [Alphaproteobacteria bacterium]